MPVERFSLRPGYEISRVIRGGWQLAGGHGSFDRKEAVADLAAFCEAGIFTFDCADIYTGVEELIGEFRAEYAQRHGGSSAEAGQGAHEVRARPRNSCRSQSRKSPRDDRALAEAASMRAPRPRAVPLVGLRRAGLHRSWRSGSKSFAPRARSSFIGGTNFDTPHTEALVAAGVPLASMQVQYSLLDARPENGLVDGVRKARHSPSLLRHRCGRVSERRLAWKTRAEAAFREPLADQVQAGHRRFRRLGAVPGLCSERSAGSPIATAPTSPRSRAARCSIVRWSPR